MKVEELKGYGMAVSEFEEMWSPEFRKKIKNTAQRIIFRHLSLIQKIRLFQLYLREKKRGSAIDLSDLRAKGLNSEKFIAQQLDYLAMFSALSMILGIPKTLEIMYKVMDATAEEAMFQNTPTLEEITSFGNNFETFRNYFAPLPEASRRAGCHELKLLKTPVKHFR